MTWKTISSTPKEFMDELEVCFYLKWWTLVNLMLTSFLSFHWTIYPRRGATRHTFRIKLLVLCHHTLILGWCQCWERLQSLSRLRDFWADLGSWHRWWKMVATPLINKSLLACASACHSFGFPSSSMFFLSSQTSNHFLQLQMSP